MNGRIHLYLSMLIENSRGFYKCKTRINHLNKVRRVYTLLSFIDSRAHIFPWVTISEIGLWFMTAAGPGSVWDVDLLFACDHNWSH